MSVVESITCRRCQQDTPKRTYATRYCPTCQKIVDDERMKPFRSQAASCAVTPTPYIEPLPTPCAVAAQRESKYRSDTEAKYADHLEGLQRAGLIVRWRYEPIRFRLADRTTYTPDFMVTLTGGSIEYHETKFTWKDRRNDASRVKIKLVAELYPEFRFVAMVKDDSGQWVREEFGR